MTEYYLIPKEDIDNLEITRMDIWDLLRNESFLVRASFQNMVTSKIYSITHRKYDVAIQTISYALRNKNTDV